MSPHEEYLPDVQACGPVRSAVITALFLTLELFFELTRREFSESCLCALEENLIPTALESLHQLFCIRQFVYESNNDFKGTKLPLILHMPYFIRKYGSPANWDTCAFETAQKNLVKAFYKRGSKRTSEVARETLTAVRMSTVVDRDRQSMACSLTHADRKSKRLNSSK